MTAPVSPPLDLKPLTALRIVAALWVVLFTYWADLKGAGPMPALVAQGGLGVELFFVLSGFILSHVYLGAFGERRFRYGGFLWARLARIYPLHVATLLAVGAMAVAAMALGQPTAHSVLYWPALSSNLLLVNAWGFNVDAGWNHPAWSISAEWFAYLLFPLFAFVAWKLRDRPRLAVGGALVVLAAIYPLFQRLAGFSLTDATIAWGALRIVPCFLYGGAINLLWRSNTIHTQPAAVASTFIFLGLSAGLAAVAAPTAMIVGAFGGLILSLASLSSTGSTLFSNRIGVYLGEVSFAVYMVAIPWKMLALSGAQKLLHLGGGGLPWPVWTAYFLGVVPVAMLAHHLVERPARSLMRRWSGFPRLRKARQAEAYAPAN